jgi:hypothetical protein
MYFIININPDGDRYAIHQDYDAAKQAYEDAKESMYSDEEDVILAKILQLNDFGFGARGDMYNADVLAQASQDTDNVDEVSKLQQAAGIKK